MVCSGVTQVLPMVACLLAVPLCARVASARALLLINPPNLSPALLSDELG